MHVDVSWMQGVRKGVSFIVDAASSLATLIGSAKMIFYISRRS
jgi:hypothetical protein